MLSKDPEPKLSEFEKEVLRLGLPLKDGHQRLVRSKALKEEGVNRTV